MKTLKNKSTRSKKFKIRVLDFLKYQLWYYLLVLVSISIICALTGKWIEGISFMFAHTVIRLSFDAQWHSTNKWICFFVTLGVFTAGLRLSLSIGVSLLGSIIPVFIISFIGAKFRKFKTAEKELEETKEELQEFKNRNIFNMGLDELTEYCKLRGLDEIEIDMTYLITKGYKGKALYKEMNYSARQCKRIRASICKKLGYKI